MRDDNGGEGAGVESSTLAAAFKEGESVRKEAAAFFAFVRKSSNVPGALKRLAAAPPPSAGLASAAVKVISELMKEEEEPAEILELWTLVWVAAHARPQILEELEAAVGEAWDATAVIARLRKTPRAALAAAPDTSKKGAGPKGAGPKGAAAKGAAPKDTSKKGAAKAAVRPPEKVSEVKAWLAAHPRVDPAVLARRPGQKAAESAAAVRALAAMATPAALDALVSYRPKVEDGSPLHEGKFGDTFNDAVSKEILTAWGRFDRRLFAERMFSGLGTLWMGHGGPAEDLTGIDAAGLTWLWIWVSPSCDLSPLERFSALSRLKVNLHSRVGGLEPLARIVALEHLELYNSDMLDQVAVDTVASAARVRRLGISVGASIDLDALARMPALERIQLAAGNREADERTVGALRVLLERGVDVSLYSFEKWPPVAAKALGDGVIVVERSGRLAFTRDASRSEALRSSLFSSAFLE